MGLRGPAPTPTALKEARGSLRAKYDNPLEPRDTVAAPLAPMDLEGVALEHWNYIVPKLLARGTLTEADLGELEGMCRWWAKFKEAAKAVERLDRGRKPYKGHMIDHPRVRMRSAWEQYSKAAIQFGLTPAAKTRVQSERGARPPKPAPTTGQPLLRIAK